MLFYCIDEGEWINLEKVEMIEIEAIGKKYGVWIWFGKDEYVIKKFEFYEDAEDFVNEILGFANRNNRR
jgi:hypothetical protein